MSTSIRTVLIDDHAIFLEALKITLGRFKTFDVIETFTSGKGVLAFIKLHPVDVIIMDIQMPEINGIELTRIISNIAPSITIVILTMLDDPISRKEALDAGATHFVFKGDNFDDLLHALNTSKNGTSITDRPYLKNIEITPEEYLQARPFRLSNREIDIYKKIVEGKNNLIIGEELFISPLTVKTHRANIMKKMVVKNSRELIAFWFTIG